MSKLKKIAALSVASIMAVSMAGCSDMSKIMTVDDYDVNAGVYINYMLSEYMEQTYSEANSGTATTYNYLDKEVENEDGKKVKLGDYLPDYAYEHTLELVAANKQFEKLGLKLSSEDTEEVNNAVKSYMENMTEEYLSEQGISKDSVTKYFTAEKQKELLFYHYYGEDGEKAVKNDDISNYLKDNYVRYKVISVPRTTAATTATSTSTSEEATTTQSPEEQTKASKKADQEAKSLANKYFKMAKQNDDFDEVISKYNAETQEPTTAATTAVTEATTVVESSNADTTVSGSSSAETTEASQTTTTTAEEPKEIHVHFYDQSGEEYGEDTPQKPQVIKSGEKAERPEDPVRDFYTFDNWYTDTNYTSVFDFEQAVNAETALYAKFDTNEVMVSTADEESVSDLAKYIKESIKNFNKPIFYEDDTNYYVIVKYDPTERNDYLIGGDYYESILQEMKYEEYEEMFDSWKKDLKIKKNEKAFEKYTPSKIEEIHNDYTSGQNDQ